MFINHLFVGFASLCIEWLFKMLETYAINTFTSRLAERSTCSSISLLVEHDHSMGMFILLLLMNPRGSFFLSFQFWYLFLITPRVLALAMFAATFRSWFWIILIAHWFGMLFWILRFVRPSSSFLSSLPISFSSSALFSVSVIKANTIHAKLFSKNVTISFVPTSTSFVIW